MRVMLALAMMTSSFALLRTAQAQPESPAAARPANGEVIYLKWCAPCHEPGIQHPGTHALQAKYGGQVPAVLRQRPNLEPSFIKTMVRHGFSIMPPFRKTEISDGELDALAQWLSQQGQSAARPPDVTSADHPTP